MDGARISLIVHVLTFVSARFWEDSSVHTCTSILSGVFLSWTSAKSWKKKIKGMRQLETVMGPWSFSHFLVDSLGAAWLWCLFPVPVLPPRSCDIRVNVIGPIDSEKASRLFSFQVDNRNFFKIILKKGILLSLVDPLLSFQVESKW